jgi:hypothetical protein
MAEPGKNSSFGKHNFYVQYLSCSHSLIFYWITYSIKSMERQLGNGKAVPQHAYGGAGGEDVYLLLLHNLGTRWGSVVSVTHRPFTSKERTLGAHWTGG